MARVQGIFSKGLSEYRILAMAWVVIAAALAGHPARAAGEPGVAWDGAEVPALFDVTGASGSAASVVLNPAAATRLERPVVAGAVTVAGGASDLHSLPPVYSAAFLDPGIGLSGGLTGVFQPAVDASAGDGEALELGYTLAATVGSVAIGARANWERRSTASGVGQGWTADVGLLAQMGPWAALGGSVVGIPVGSGTLSPAPSRGRAGLTLSAPAIAGGPLEGSFVALGWEDSDLSSRAGGTLVVGGRLLTWKVVALDGTIGYDPRLGQPGSWAVSVGLFPSSFALEIGYASRGLYHLGVGFNL